MQFNVDNTADQATHGESISFDEIVAESQAMIEQGVRHIGEIDPCGIVKHVRNERWMMILEDVSGGGRWRIQNFDANGFEGHIIFSNKVEAVRHAAAQDFTARDDGALDRIQNSDSFQAGLYASDQLRLLNGGDITFKDYCARMKAFQQEAGPRAH